VFIVQAFVVHARIVLFREAGNYWCV